MGCDCFDRTSQGVELTAYGHALLKCGVNVFDDMRQGLRQIEFLTDPTSGDLAVGCPEIMNAGIMPAISERLLRQHPGVRLQVVHADIALLQFNLLRERKVELLIGRMPEPFVEDDLVSEPLLLEPFVAVAGASSKWARRRRVELADLMGKSWVLPPHDSTPGSIISGLFSQWIEVSEGRGRDTIRSTDHRADRNRQFRRHPAQFRCPLQRWARWVENPADNDTGHPLFDRDPHRQEPYSGTVRDAVHRACASRCKIVIDLISLSQLSGSRSY